MIDFNYGWGNPQTDYDAKVIGQADRTLALARDTMDAYYVKCRDSEAVAVADAGLGGKDYPQPETTYAADPDPDPKNSRVGLAVGQLLYETIILLKQRLNLTPNKQHAQDDVDALAEDLVESSCSGAGRLGAQADCQFAPAGDRPIRTSVTAPERRLAENLGRPSRYDVVLRLDRDPPGKEWKFRQLFPRLLSGDSDAPVDQPLT